MKTQLSYGAIGLAAALCLAFTGCLTDGGDDYKSDGSVGFMNQEAVNMGLALSGSAGAKVAQHAEQESIARVLGYNDTCHCFVRTSSFTFTNPHGKTFTRFRSDSIWLDSAGQYLTVFRPRHASTITHHRRVIKLNGAMDIDVQINVTLTWVVENGDTTAQWDGTITGTYDGVPFKDGTINGVINSFFAGFWVPTGGKMHFKRGDFDIDLVFKGSGKAHADVKGHGKTRRIECDGGDESDG